MVGMPWVCTIHTYESEVGRGEASNIPLEYPCLLSKFFIFVKYIKYSLSNTLWSTFFFKVHLLIKQ